MYIYPRAATAAFSKVVRLVLPAQIACELSAPLSSPANLQLIVRKGNTGRGGGDRNDKCSNKACALKALQARATANWNKRNIITKLLVPNHRSKSACRLFAQSLILRDGVPFEEMRTQATLAENSLPTSGLLARFVGFTIEKYGR
jgi:hypothetical protein